MPFLPTSTTAERRQRRRIFQTTAGAALLPTLGPAARPQSAWPNRPITLIMPFAAGGGTDAFARRIVEDMQAEMRKAFATPDLSAVWTGRGAETPTLCGYAFARFVSSEVERGAEVVRTSGAKLDG